MNGVQWNIGMVLDVCNGRQANWLGKVREYIGGVSLVVVVVVVEGGGSRCRWERFKAELCCVLCAIDQLI